MDIFEKFDELEKSGKSVEFVLGVNGTTYRVRGTVADSSGLLMGSVEVKDEDGKTHTLVTAHLLDIVEDQFLQFHKTIVIKHTTQMRGIYYVSEWRKFALKARAVPGTARASKLRDFARMIAMSS